jgi:hypothetical protein
VNVLFTIVVLGAAAMWGLAVYTRLVRLRTAVKEEFKRLQASAEAEADGKRYNAIAKQYNDALEVFPANIVASIAGFRPAQMFVNTKLEL